MRKLRVYEEPRARQPEYFLRLQECDDADEGKVKLTVVDKQGEWQTTLLLIDERGVLICCDVPEETADRIGTTLTWDEIAVRREREELS